MLNRIKPSKEEEKVALDLANAFLKKLNAGLKGAKAILGGSLTKGTWIKGTNEIDIFVQFDYNKYKDKNLEISDILEKHLKKKWKVERLHGSRDYFHIKQNGFTLEIVPILKITKEEQAVNITDISPLHAEWVKKSSNEKIRDQIRLLKQFCKGNNCYGAETYIGGFSGYVCEILTICYKSFENVLKASQSWKMN